MTKYKLIKLAGMVRTYFQFASHFKCMKNKMTNNALAVETAIISPHITCGALSRSDLLLPTAKEITVRTQRATNTAIYCPNPPCDSCFE